MTSSHLFDWMMSFFLMVWQQWKWVKPVTGHPKFISCIQQPQKLNSWLQLLHIFLLFICYLTKQVLCYLYKCKSQEYKHHRYIYISWYMFLLQSLCIVHFLYIPWVTNDGIQEERSKWNKHIRYPVNRMGNFTKFLPIPISKSLIKSGIAFWLFQ